MPLKEYRKKRDFGKTPEPAGKEGRAGGGLTFFVQKHAARRLHYDLRLEAGGVLKSWAVPKEPELKPSRKLAVMVEDHPLDYGDFEGVIPKGNYGAGTVMLWDRGVYYPVSEEGQIISGREIEEEIQAGKLNFFLDGEKLKGRFALVRIRNSGKDWLLIKKKDAFSGNLPGPGKDVSVISRRGMDEIARENAGRPDISDAGKEKYPSLVFPMLASLSEEPFDRSGWIFELKLDGYRTIAMVRKGACDLFSRRGNNMNSSFRPVAAELSEFGGDIVLDGEMVVVDKSGKPDFQLLQNYMRTGKGNLLYYIFDILHLDGRNLRNLPLKRRKEILEAAVGNNMKFARKTDWIEEKGTGFFRQAEKFGLEGVIGKSLNSKYKPGKRSDDWLKFKIARRQDAVVGGYTEPRGSRKKIGSLILGIFEGEKLSYIGHSGTGLAGGKISEAWERLKGTETDEMPFLRKPKTNEIPHWVEPKSVCEVRYTEWTDGGHLRHPVFVRWLDGKDPGKVKREKDGKMRGRMPARREEAVKSGSRIGIKITNPEKIYWPEEKYVKADVIEYYSKIASVILPYLKDRPQNLHRHPNGVEEKGFYQKNIEHKPPAWVKTERIYSASNKKHINYLVCQDKETLLYMANLGCIEINPWNSRLKTLDFPDYAVMDLDPNDIGMDETVKAALAVKYVLDRIGAKSLIKTSGGRGLHIFIPLGAKYDYEQAKNFTKLIGIAANKRLPDTTSLERSPAKRRKMIYLDYLQNSKGQTIAAAYSLRPKPGATVSAPIEWKEVKKGLKPENFDIKTVHKRLGKKGDLWKGGLSRGINMKKALIKLKDLL